MKITVVDAAKYARTDAANVRAALASGDLRSLDQRHVEAWVRGRVAGQATDSYRADGAS